MEDTHVKKFYAEQQTNLERHGVCINSTVAEGYIEETIKPKGKTSPVLSAISSGEAGTSNVLNKASNKLIITH